MEIAFSGALTLDEFTQGMKLNTRPVVQQEKSRLDTWLLVVVAGSLMTVIGVLMVIFTELQWSVYLFLAGLFAALIGSRMRKTPQELWKRNPGYREQREGVINDEGVVVTTPAGSSRLAWSDLSGFGEYKDVVVLFQDDEFEVILSQRFFQSEAEWEQFKTLVAQKLVCSHKVQGNFKAFIGN